MSDRADRLASDLDGRPFDSLLVTSLTNIEYLTGFTGSNAACLVTADSRTFFTDFRYAESAQEIDDWQVEIISGEWTAGLAKHLEGQIGIEDDKVTVRTARRLQDSLADGSELIDAGDLVEKLRRVRVTLNKRTLEEALNFTCRKHR